MLGGDLVVAGPPGFCVDPGVSKPRRGFAVISSCAVLGGDTRPGIDGLATVQFGDADSASVAGSEPAMRAFLETPQGGALLSATGDAQQVEVLETIAADNRVGVFLRDAEPSHVPGLQSEEWRMFFDLDGRLVTVAVRGLVRAPLNAERSRRLMEDMVAAIIAVNAAETPDPS